jgi:hypothetical protein
MKRFNILQACLVFMMLILSGLLITGCGSSDEAALATGQVDNVLPGACTEAGPKVVLSNPADNDEGVSTTKAITVSFSEAMDPTTIVVTNSGDPEVLTFTLRDNNELTDTEGTVAMSLSNTVATFTPDAALNGDSWYTATITTYAKSAGGTSLGCSYQWQFKTGTIAVAGQAPVFLGAAAPYGVLAGESITLGGGPNSVTGFRVDGDVGVSPGSTCTGCDTTTVTGLIESGTAPAAAAKVALVAAYNDAIGRATNICVLGSDSLSSSATACGGINNFTYKPGLYRSGTSLTIVPGATIVLDAEGDASAVFIFQSASTLDTVGGGTQVLLDNGAQAKNVFWLVETSATIGGTTSTFVGTVMALSDFTVNTGTAMSGRALARNGSVTVQDGALITVPAP